MKERITDFIETQTCASVCCVDEQENPYSFSCFYAFNAEQFLLYFKSGNDTKHARFLSANPLVAGTILPDKIRKLTVKGIQFEGNLLPQDHKLAESASTYYYNKHPLAKLIAGEVWTVCLNRIKFTDNSLGFGTKLMWEREINLSE
ncbi:MAG: hypothetical protein FJY20_06980 [Bacteroidetes bacterium]|nr:hypothetical protein [Bacteroidota bacterium]